MVISLKKKVIFVRNIKSGSTSFKAGLASIEDMTKNSAIFRFCRRIPFLSTFKRYSIDFQRPHLGVAAIQALIGEEIFAQCHVFGVFRDPLAWNVSVYKHWERFYKNSKFQKVPKTVRSFRDFILFRSEQYKPLQVLQFAALSGDILVTELGNFKEIDTYWSSLNNRFSFNQPLERLNNSSKDQRVLVSKRDQSLLEKLCAIDFELYEDDTVYQQQSQICRKAEKFASEIASNLKAAGGLNFDPWVFTKSE